MAIKLYKGDLPDKLDLGSVVAVDTETTGLSGTRDRLCLVQISSGDGHAHLVQLEAGNYAAPNLKKLLADDNVLKIYHFARFDLMMLKLFLGIEATPAYCTRTASRLARTYTDRHGLRDVCRELLGVEISKQQQSSYWGADELSKEQLNYAANDVLHLHKIKEKLDVMLEREGRTELAQRVFDFLQTRADLDIEGWPDLDIFAH